MSDSFEACEECSGTGVDLADGDTCFNCDGHAMFQVADTYDSGDPDSEDEDEDEDDYDDEADEDDE